MKKKRFETFYESSEDIPLVLDSYNDLFSDFDPRSYSERSLSWDFLRECKKATSDKKGKIHLKFYVSKNKRKPMNEIKIKKRLKDHFHKHFLRNKDEINKIKKSGFTWLFLGAFVILLTAIFDNSEGFWFNLLLALAHPAGWFFTWEGLAKLLITSKEKNTDFDFYKKMLHCVISFYDY